MNPVASNLALAETTRSPESIATRVASAIAALGQGAPVDLTSLPRNERLSVINGVLAHHHLRPLEGIGDHRHGQIEITGINRFTPCNFVPRVDFQVLGANGKPFNHLCYMSANTAQQSGAICVLEINGHIAFVRQFRPVIGTITTELPRGFPDPGDFKRSKMLGVVEREVREETGISLTGSDLHIQRIGVVSENTGTHNVKNDCFYVRMQIPAAEFAKFQERKSETDGGKNVTGLVLIPKARVLDYGGDNHTCTALLLALRAGELSLPPTGPKAQ